MITRVPGTSSSRAAEPKDAVDSVSREISSGYVIGVSGAIAVVWVILLTITGPGTFDVALNPLPRLGFFAGVLALSWPFGHAFAAVAFRVVGPRSPVAVAALAVAAGLWAAANAGAVAYALDELFVPELPGELSPAAIFLLAAVMTVAHTSLIYTLAWERTMLWLQPGSTPDAAALPARPAAVPSVEEPAADVPFLAERHPIRQAEAEAKAKAAAEEPHARFLDRLPREIGRDIVYIRCNGHYLDVVTKAGTATLLMRFADALLELGDVGVRVHRSFWVAHAHIDGAISNGKRARIRMTNGELVPVSRTYRVEVSEAVSAPELSIHRVPSAEDAS